MLYSTRRRHVIGSPSHQASSSSPIAAACNSRVTDCKISAHLSGAVVGAHITYSTLPSGLAWMECARSFNTISFAAPLLYPPPDPSSTSTASTQPMDMTPLTLGSIDNSFTDPTSQSSRSLSVPLGPRPCLGCSRSMSSPPSDPPRNPPPASTPSTIKFGFASGSL